MTYSQYNDIAITGFDESIKNRVDNNSNSSNSETSSYPNKFDLFVNKENSSVGSFSVTETHTLSQLAGSTLYLDHRPSVDYTGGITSFVISDGGVIDSSLTDLAYGTVQFTTLPSASPFTVTYSAAPDKVQDSHLNSLQNTVMNLQQAVGLKQTVGGNGTGLITLPIVVYYDPSSLSEHQVLQDILPNIVLPAHLSEDFYLGSTDVVGVPGYGQGITIYIGQPSAVTRDDVWIDADNFTLATTNGLAGAPGGTYRFGLTTGDSIGISGIVQIASQTDIGLPGGARANISMYVPGGGAASFYATAALRVHGGIWFGSGMSGNGSITFITTTGEAVDIQGNLIATTLDVNSTSNFDGTAQFHNNVSVDYPGQLITNNDIVLNTKPNETPSKIDNLDPSYAAHIVGYIPTAGEIVQSVRLPINNPVSAPYLSGAKQHPVYGFWMYPMIGGWTYTGSVKYEAASISGNQNILLIDSAMLALGTPTAPAGTAPSLGGGSSTTGDYCTGLFNPGDTFIEIRAASDQDAYSYPIYDHQPFYNGGTVTGLNIYVAADDAALQSSIAGKQYRIYQPGNVPMGHMGTGWGGALSAPLAIVGTQSSSDYPYGILSYNTDRAWLGGNYVTANSVQFKRTATAGATTVSIADALKKSINMGTAPSTGIAYIYAVGSDTNGTAEQSITLRASPSPWGIASPNMQMGTPRNVPGQHVPIGEVIAKTTDGTTWSHVESVGYRENGYYDSCWVPLTNYTSTPTVPNIGRTLPFWTSSTQSDGGEDAGYYQFFVEHNLGPVLVKTDIDYKLFIAGYGTTAFAANPSSTLTGDVNASEFKLSARGSQNLWTPFCASYVSGPFAASPAGSASRGFLRDITNGFNLAYLDSRFAKFVWNSNSMEISEFQGKNSRLAGYIRVILRKTR